MVDVCSAIKKGYVLKVLRYTPHNRQFFKPVATIIRLSLSPHMYELASIIAE